MLHWIYPHLCELCGCPCEQEICTECAERLPRVPLPICLYCGAPAAGDLADPYHCRNCSPRPRSFDFARSALAMSERALHLVYRLKYHHANYLAGALGGILDRLWQETPLLLEEPEWCLVPVPAAKDHLFNRGYNQAEELARALARRRGLRVVCALERRATGVDSQTRLSGAERWKNALAAYAARPAWEAGRRRLGRHVLLVDDVYTTGSTARACARVLRALPGVEKVGVLTLMRAGH